MNRTLFKKLAFLFCFFTFAFTLFAHEFWLQPDKFIYHRGENINIRFWAGENFEGMNWSGNNSKVNSLKLYLGDAVDNISPQLSEEKGDSLQFSIYDESTVMVTFNSTNSFIELPAQKFNDYLKEDGLQNAIDYWQQNKLTDSSARELYQRSVKTIIQIGAKKNNVSVATDLPLDIIPEINPYTFKNKDSVSFKLLFNKQPMIHQPVKVWQRNNNLTHQQQITTDEYGRIKFKINTLGKWMVSTVKIIKLENNEKADWQSFWGNCTWGYD